MKKMDNYSGVKWEDFDIELTNVQQYKDAFNSYFLFGRLDVRQVEHL